MRALDPDALRRLMTDLGGDPEVMRELIDTFLAEAPRTVGEMRAALSGSDRRTLNRGAHSMKSTAATFGATELSRMCRELERDTERELPGDAPARVAQVEAEWARVRAELVAWKP